MELTDFLVNKAIEIIAWSNNTKGGTISAELSSKELNRIIDDIYLRGYTDATNECSQILGESI